MPQICIAYIGKRAAQIVQCFLLLFLFISNSLSSIFTQILLTHLQVIFHFFLPPFLISCQLSFVIVSAVVALSGCIKSTIHLMSAYFGHSMWMAGKLEWHSVGWNQGLGSTGKRFWWCFRFCKAIYCSCDLAIPGESPWMYGLTPLWIQDYKY